MNQLKILNSKEKKEIEKKLDEQFGVNNVHGILAMRGKERIFFYSGSFNEEDIREIEKIAFIERIGVYFGKVEEKIDEIRLSIEGSQILGNQIKKNIFEIPDDEIENWMKGRELNIKTGKRGFLIMKYKNNFLGTGKASEEKIGNFIPKNRRLKNKD